MVASPCPCPSSPSLPLPSPSSPFMGPQAFDQIHASAAAQPCLRPLQDPQPQYSSSSSAAEDILKQSSPLLPSSPTSSSSSVVAFDVESGDCALAASGNLDVAAGLSALEQVDSFLIEALNSRNRITVLRLEQEIERFMRNSKQQQLQFKPMPSSYERLAAHRVAQHYHLQSMVADCGTGKGSRIVLLKTAESRLPDIRLVDIPVTQEKPTTVPPEKFAIKQRANGSFRANGFYHGAGESGSITPAKTVEERKEEYNKARARIFSNMDLTGRVMEDNGTTDVLAVSKSGDKVTPDNLSELLIRGASISNGVGKGRTDDEIASGAKAGNRVAIFRDREKDKKDPDYDRSYDRYSQRMNSGFGMSIGPFSMHAMYTPFLNVNSEFSRSDGPGQLQMQLDHASYLTAQHPRGPWVASAGCMGFYPDPFCGPFSQGQSNMHTGSEIYLPSPRVSHLDHYSHMDARFQRYCQPAAHHKANFREVRNQ